MESLEIQLAAIDELEPYENNPVEHDPDQIDALAESIQNFGFKNPLIISPDNQIVSGHGRLEAIQQCQGELQEHIERHQDEGNETIAASLERLQEGVVPVMVADDLTEAERDEFRIADNKVFEHSEWDEDSLKFELRELEQAVGFDDEEVDSILSTNIGEIDYDPDTVQEKKEEIESHYEDLVNEKQSKKTSVPCPHCSNLVTLDTDQLRKALIRDHYDSYEGYDDDTELNMTESE